MDLLLVRHGETDFNRDQRVQGLVDNPLNDVGFQQARMLARVLAIKEVAAVYTSPLLRARSTAEALAEMLKLPVVVEEGLRELHPGELDGLTGDEMRTRYPEVMRAWVTNAANVRLPGGESLQDCQDRTWGVVEQLRDRHPDAAVVAVSHNLAILSVVCRALGLDLGHFRRLRLENAALTEISFADGRVVLRRFNDVCHL